jgi:ribosomal protein L39E
MRSSLKGMQTQGTKGREGKSKKVKKCQCEKSKRNRDAPAWIMLTGRDSAIAGARGRCCDGRGGSSNPKTVAATGEGERGRRCQRAGDGGERGGHGNREQGAAIKRRARGGEAMSEVGNGGDRECMARCFCLLPCYLASKVSTCGRDYARLHNRSTS